MKSFGEGWGEFGVSSHVPSGVDAVPEMVVLGLIREFRGRQSHNVFLSEVRVQLRQVLQVDK